MFQPSTIAISRSAYANDLAFIRERLGGARFCSVVKGNAYGHGIRSFVPMAMQAGVDYFAVYGADEAYTLLNSVDKRPDVFIMGMVEDDALAWAIEQGVECAISDLPRLDAALRFAEHMGVKARIHVELETGMHRTGFAEHEVPALIDRLLGRPELYELTGVFTHFAGAESSVNDERIMRQIERFHLIKELFKTNGLHPRYAHQACSAAVMNFPSTIGTMARVGIMQYGLWSNRETWSRYSASKAVSDDPLQRLITWTSRVMAVTQVDSGAYIGYGTSCVATRDMRVAVVPIGYSHGFDRGLSNTGHVLIRGQRAPITGIVNMNAISVDVTDLDQVEKGDEVVLIGEQGRERITVSSFSEMSEQLNYEMLTRLPADIPRLITD